MSISIIMPCYNAGVFLAPAIESVQGQTYRDWELLIVDDSSTDGSLNVIKEYAGKDARIKLLESDKRLGAAGARNLGTKAAQYPYLCYFDADDVLRPDALATLYAAIHGQDKYGVVYANYVRIDEVGRIYGSRQWTNKLFKRPSGDVAAAFLRQNWIVNGGIALVRRDLVERVGGWERSLRSSDDRALWCLLATQTAFLYIPRYVALEYREIKTGMTQSTVKTFDSFRPAMDFIYGHPMVQARFNEVELRELRRVTEAHHWALMAGSSIRRHEWWQGWHNLCHALQTAPHYAPKSLMMVLLAILDVASKALRR